MKTILLFAALFLMSSKMGLGEGNSYIDNNFNDYVNSPEDSSGTTTSVNKDINITPQAHPEERHEAGKNPEKTAAKPAPLLQGIPAKWQACTADSDCTAAVADCMSWEPMNKVYLKRLSKNLGSCSESIDPGFQPKAVCAAKMCRTTQDITGVSWEEWLSEMSKRKGQ